MDPLSVRALSPATIHAVGALRPPASTDAGKASSLFVQGLAQGLLQQSLQATSLSPLVEGVTGRFNLGQEATASLLAALNAPQAVADTTANANATTNPIALQPATTDSTTPSASPVSPTPGETPASQDSFATSLSTDFALQTALRFGAGVVGMAAPVTPTSTSGPGLVRDAVAVIRAGSLQDQAGGPGPEAFQRSRTNLEQVLRTYQTEPIAPQSARLDLLA